jgi:hypothetical protein
MHGGRRTQAGVVEIPNLQGLLRLICERGFEHHVAANPAPDLMRAGLGAERLRPGTAPSAKECMRLQKTFDTEFPK